MAFTPLQYRSHIDRNRGCPPISHTLIVTFPLVTFLILKPTVGIISSTNWPEAITLTKVVLPEFCRPTSVSSISSFQNRDFNQSSRRLIAASIVASLLCPRRVKEWKMSNGDLEWPARKGRWECLCCRLSRTDQWSLMTDGEESRFKRDESDSQGWCL